MVLTDERQTSAGAIAVGCLLMLLGPLGILFALLGAGRGGGKTRVPAYALIARGAAGKPLALLFNRADSQSIVEAYQAIGDSLR